MFGINFQDYTPIAAIFGAWVELRTEVRFIYMLLSKMLILTLVLGLYTYVRWAVSVPVWIAIWVVVAVYYRYYDTGRPAPASPVKVTEIPTCLRIDDFVIITRSKEQILATELARLMANCQMDTMRISGSVVPVSDCQTLINQVD